jgi:hypothetical protein
MLTQDERGQVEAIQRRLKQQHAAIDTDENLSRQGKRALKARAQLDAEKAHRAIIEAADARHAQATRDAYFRTFGMKANGASDVLADRDARHFAAKLDNPGDALRELAAAELRGAVSLSTAIAERAWKSHGKADVGGHWEKVLRAFADGSATRNRNLGALAELDGDNSPAGRFTDSLYRHLARPEDLQHGDIEAIAASADGASTGGL